MTPGWVTPKGAADYLQVSESTLYALRRAGDGPRYAKRGQLVRYSIADLDAWMRQNMEDPNENEWGLGGRAPVCRGTRPPGEHD